MIIRGPKGNLHIRAKNDLITHQLYPTDIWDEAWILDDVGNELFRGPADEAFKWAFDYHTLEETANE